MTLIARSALLAAVLSLAPPLAAQVADGVGMDGLSSWIDDLSVAHAYRGKFAGKVKFERKMNEYYHTAPVGSDPTGTTVETVIELIGHELQIPPTNAPASNAGVRFHGAVTGEGPYVVAVEWRVDPKDPSKVETVKIEVPDLLPDADETATKATGPYGIRIRARAADDDGGVRLVVSNVDRAWDPNRVGKVTIFEGETAIPLERGGTRMRYVADLEVDQEDLDVLLDGVAYTARATLFDANGVVLDTSVLMDVVGGDDSRPTAEKVRVGLTKAGNLQVVSYTRDPGLAVGAVAVRVTDAKSGKALLDETSSAPAGTERQFAATVTFEDPAAAPGELYTAVLGLRDASGKPVAETEVQVEVVGPDAAEGEGNTYFEVEIDGAAVEAVVSISQVDDHHFAVFAAVASDRVEAFDLVFVDYGVGPAPVPTELALPVVGEWHRWVHKGKAGTGSIGAGGLGHVEVTVTDPSGALLDLTGGSVDEVPAILFHNGSGTKNAHSQVSARPELL